MQDWMFWAVAGSIALAVAAVLIQTLRRASETQEPATNHDLRVYRDQLAEVERDIARGTLPEDEAARLRTEVSRRLLEADRQHNAPAAAPRTGFALAGGLVILAIGFSFFAYTRIGAPGYPDLPLKERFAMSEELRKTRPSQAQAVADAPKPAPATNVDPAFLDLMDKLRAAVKDRPDDPRGLELLARNEASLGNLAAAIDAQRGLIAAKGASATADDYAALAEVMILQAGGYVSPEAEAELVNALKIDPRNGLARYYSGLMFAQIGRADQTFRLWKPLLDEGPADAPWITPIRDQIEEVAGLAGVQFQLPPVGDKGPSAEDMQAAASMSPEERLDMIRGMVGQLSDRLAAEGGPVADWAKLISSLGVLGETDHAAEIYAEARSRFAADPTALETLSQAATQAGITP